MFYQKRCSRVQALLEKEGLDALLVMKPVNRYYLSGFTGSAGILILTAKDIFLLTDFRYVEQALSQSQHCRVLRHGSDWLTDFEQLLQELNAKTIGYEQDYLTCGQLKTFNDKLKNIDFTGTQDLIENLREVKDDQEINWIKEAAAIADTSFKHLLNIIKPGLTEVDIAAELEYFMRRKGSEKPAFDTIVASGVRSSLPHGLASDKKLQLGDFVVIDFGAVFCGYHSDLTRTVVIGKASAKQKEIYNLVLKVQERGVQEVKAGRICSEIDAEARGIISWQGYGDNFGHSLGHGVGLDIHENPRLAAKNNKVLKTGMIVTVEPGVYLEGWGGVRIEDLVLVHDNGCQLLSQASKELFEL